ncbi:MAG: hypothetical protein J7L39_03825, partial [Candidatus Aenigmarchaeota archaeon]|nr:hypothetical protein [Candidatus Aenigmarchaeota archaeon]
ILCILFGLFLTVSWIGLIWILGFVVNLSNVPYPFNILLFIFLFTNIFVTGFKGLELIVDSEYKKVKCYSLVIKGGNDGKN